MAIIFSRIVRHFKIYRDIYGHSRDVNEELHLRADIKHKFSFNFFYSDKVTFTIKRN
jgi:hypothetical protein